MKRELREGMKKDENFGAEAEREFTQLETKVLDWGMARGILAHSDSKAQFLKTVEEVGELSSALAKNNYIQTRDAIGDVLVTLAFVAYHSNLDLTECMRHAYNEIKDRTGYLTAEGVFVKDEGLAGNIHTKSAP